MNSLDLNNPVVAAAVEEAARLGPRFSNLTMIGREFGRSAIAVGKKLKALGLRTPENTPSERAIRDGFVQKVDAHAKWESWVWHHSKTVAALVDAGWTRLEK